MFESSLASVEKQAEQIQSDIWSLEMSICQSQDETEKVIAAFNE